MICYLDTSAALKLVIQEAESASLATSLNRHASAGDDLISSMLLFTEMHCAADRRVGIPIDSVNTMLDSVDLVDLDRVDLFRAATSQWRLRSADAIHLAVALRLQSDVLIGYDTQMLAAAQRAGLTVDSPS